jgi:DnaK suppressor protein
MLAAAGVVYAAGVNDLSSEQAEELRRSLLALREELQQLLSITRESTKPVNLDEPIGRLTRMAAIQQQNMSAANRRAFDLRIRQVQQALALMDRDEYGLCRRCEDPIGFPRLKARPESPYCLNCQDAIDRKNG